MDRGLSTPFVFGLLLLVILAAFYIPFVIDDTTGTRMLAINQTEGTEIQVYHELNASISNINAGQDEIDVTLKDTETRNETAGTLSEGVAQDFILEGETITVNATIINGGTAEMEYTYPVDYNWPDGAKTLVDNLGLIIMGLLVFLFIGVLWVEL